MRDLVRDNGRSYDVVSPCPGIQLDERARLFSAAQVPAVHANSTMETFKRHTTEQAKGRDLVQEFLHGWPTSRGFIVSGPVGTGKTHLLAAALRHLTLERGVSCAYVEISLLFAQIRRGFNEGRSGGEIIQPLSRLDVLAIDEIGKGRGSAFELETLDELIARRYNSGRVTLFATNYSLNPPDKKATGYLTSDSALEASKDSRLLCDKVGERIYSRLCEMCDLVEFPTGTADMRRSRSQMREAR